MHVDAASTGKQAGMFRIKALVNIDEVNFELLTLFDAGS